MAHSTDNLDKLIQDKTYVVVQRLFHTKPVEHIAQINKEIQQVIKSQNLTLRKLFFSKYMELLNCSKLINDIETFANRIDDISTDILKNAEKYRQSDVELPIKQDAISIIQRLIRKGKLLEAMKIATSDKSQDQMIEILKIDILEAVQEKLQTTLKIPEIQQIIKCLALFIFRQAQKYKNIDYEQEYGKPLSILMKQYNGSNDTSQCLIASIKTAFFILTTAMRQVHTKQDIVEYVKTLEHIMELTQGNFQNILNSLVKQCQLPQPRQRPTNKSLHDVQICCFAQLHKSLAKTMLSNNNKIKFNHELYESIMRDQELLQNLRRLQKTLKAKNSLENVLKTLWRDFYRQTVDSAVSTLDINHYSNLMMKSTMLSSDYPLEIQKHMQDKTAQKILQIYRKFSNVLRGQIQQLKAIMQDDIKQYLETSLISAINKWPHKIAQCFTALTPKQKIMLSIGCELLKETIMSQLQTLLKIGDFGQQMQKITENQIQSANTEMLKEFPKIQQRTACFQQKIMEFVPYIKGTQNPIFKQIVFFILKSLEKCHSGRDSQKLKYTQRCLTNQAEELTTFTCLFQHISKHLFHQQVNIERSNIKITEDMLLQQKCQRRTNLSRKNTVAIPDKKELFDIGEAKDMLKMASKITSSIFGMIKSSIE